MWKDFFYFTKTERTGFYVLIVLIFVALLVYWTIPFISSSTQINSEQMSETAYKEFLASVHQRDRNWNFNDYYVHKKQAIILAPFDPNTADSITFVRLGIRPILLGIFYITALRVENSVRRNPLPKYTDFLPISLSC